MPVPRAKIGKKVGELEIWCVCVSGAVFQKVVGMWAVGPQRTRPSGASVSQEVAQLHSKQVQPQLLKETSLLAFGVKMTPRHNSASHLLRLRQEACQPLV